MYMCVQWLSSCARFACCNFPRGSTIVTVASATTDMMETAVVIANGHSS